MESLTVVLNINTQAFLTVYQGTVSTVSALADDGRRVSFPAETLKPFIKPHGIHGRFRLDYDTNGKLKKIHQIGD